MKKSKKMHTKMIEDIYKDNLDGSDMPDDAKMICERNQKLFVETMEKAEKMLTEINRCPDYEFQISICNNLSKVFMDMMLSYALRGKRTEETPRYIG